MRFARRHSTKLSDREGHTQKSGQAEKKIKGIISSIINDLPSGVHCCKIVLYADDTSLFFADRNIQTIQSAIQEDLNALGEWFSLNRLLVNCDKTNVMLFGSKKRLARSQGLSLFLLGKLLELFNTVKYLGLTFGASMDWHEHINNISYKVTRRLNLL